jgi:hypothetical protein
MERTVPLALPIEETFDIGSKTGTPIDDRDYETLFAFTGTIGKLTICVEPPILTDDDKKQPIEGEGAARDSH